MNLTRGINLRKIAELMPGASGAEVKVRDPKPLLRLFYPTAQVVEDTGSTATPCVVTSSLKGGIASTPQMYMSRRLNPETQSWDKDFSIEKMDDLVNVLLRSDYRITADCTCVFGLATCIHSCYG